ncbi:MAG: PolC-type DNA polymerase III [Blautia sp.]|nr:PolC-type DNA polymerase III [Lachnoclostridium sp.]MCM1210955.1 PolC-type DNA polymerase III [Blautia sp.]
MSKKFFDVFPTLKLDSGLEDLYEQVMVERISATKRKEFLRIYIASDRLIQKEDVFRVEREMKKQFFPNAAITIRIYEKFRLSSQYNPEKLMNLYKDSILLELREYSPIEYHLFKNADITYPAENQVMLTLEDTVMGKEKAEELLRILDKIYNERCGFSVEILSSYKERTKNRRREEDEQKFAMQIAEISARAGKRSEGAGQTVKEGESKAAEADKKTASVDRAKESAGSMRGEKKYSGDMRRPLKRSNNPDVIYGRDFEEEAIAIEEVIGEIGEVVIRGRILNLDKRALRNERTILIFDVTDLTDTITIKMFIGNEQLEEITSAIKPGAFVKIKGTAIVDKFDHELTIGSVYGIKKIPDFTTSRVDHSVHKRVELHCHTKMSDMDGVSEAKDIVKRAYQWGHPAIAITDHGVLQAFPDANHVWEDLWKAEKNKRKEAGDEDPDKQDFFKVIYGVEAYLVDDLKEIVTNDKGQNLEETFVVFDIETTGFSPVHNKIIEIGAVKVSGGQITERFSTFVNPDVPIPFEIEKLTGIQDNMVVDAPHIDVALPQFLEFCGDAVLVAHNASFDMGFIMENCDRLGIGHDFTYVDTVGIARILLPGQAKHTLDAVAKTLGISLENHHRAVEDAEATAEIFVKFIPMLQKDSVNTLADINLLGKSSPDIVKKLPTYHAIILAKNNVGRMNLYRLVSESHLNYFARRPRIPKSLLQQYREGLILGSACEAGELYRALLDGKSDAEIARIVRFYDYLEIQPLGNNQFMIASEKLPQITSMEDIMNINRKIVRIGEQFHKPVAATCDVHFLDPEDEVYRRIIMAGQHFSDADNQAPLYFRTTEEMLEEFAYLGSEKAQEVVITNTNLIADMIESMSPVRPDKCPPVIADSDKLLTDICYKKAHELYGEELPEIVRARLERELHSIISNGFAVMYIIAQKLVWKSVEDGYLVGSRGSVGSSFVANMAGITEVNSLSPHYLCPKCHYYDFDSEEVKAYSGGAGCDMPDKDCPVCGTPLQKEGFDIPFETFLGFKGDKEPDIDLNFSGEYQSKAHKYTEVIFGYGQTYRAGTIGTLADKTAFGYVKNYYEERGQRKRICEINRIVAGCTGVRRSTGQHPGGIVVLPVGEDINSFTPVQHPANDMKTDIVTTHFDYHSIDHNLLKLDILGHDDPTMIRMLQDLTGIDPVTIPLDDKQVMSLFASTEALGITPEQISGCKLGCLGIPEFGTDFAMQMVIDAKPKCFTDLVRIAGLAHGTDVWLGNAQTLIEEGKATISTAICCRDDIMIYLIQMGVDPALSFTIMESVRKGKGLKPEWEEAMKAANVPDWYIWSCKKIKYMFPKAHAAAYVMMAWRIAYCKINYPLAYYAAFFSIRASGFSYELMCQGQQHLEEMMSDYKRRSDTLSKKEQDSYRDMKIVQEMYARGFEFTPIDLFSAQANAFQIVDDKRLMPSFSSIDGLGEKAAEAVVEAAKDGPFLSKDDFRQRTKVSQTVTELMDNLGILGNLPESNQISLFDFAM